MADYKKKFERFTNQFHHLHSMIKPRCFAPNSPKGGTGTIMTAHKLVGNNTTCIYS
jgi:hypothetical protein